MRHRLLSSTALVLAATGTPALAQVATPAATSDANASPVSASTLGTADASPTDIVVTAQRREEKLFDVPLTVNVISGDAIEKKNLATIRDVLEHSPQVNYQQTGDSRTDTLSIRGISSVSNASGVEPDAAIVIDGETLARTMQMNYDAVDIDRIEILEGPQGTLFGKNAVAGLINIVTRGPKLSDKTTGEIKLDLAQDNEYRLKASVNVPVGDTSALYVNAYGAYQGGWEKNVHDGEPNGGAEKGAGIRVQYLWKPDPTLSIKLKGEYSYKKTGIIPYAFKELSADDVHKASATLSGDPNLMAQQFFNLLSNSGINLVSSSGVSTPIINGTKSYLYDDRTWGKTNSYAFSLTAEKKLDWATIHYLGTYRYYNLYSNDNEWGVSAPQLTNSPAGLNTLNYAGPSRERTVQQELRLESDTSGRLSYVAGAFYYFNDNYHRETNRTCNDAVYGYYNGAGYPDPNPTGPVDNFQCTGGYTGRYTVNDFQTRIKTYNEAFFGDVQYNPIGGLTVFAGARALWEQQHMTLQHLPDDTTASYFFNPDDPFGEVSASSHRNAITHRLGFKYNFGPVMIYGTESTGFKGVSWDNYGLASAARAVDPLKPEKPHQWEAGLRANLFHDRLNFQFSAFDLRDHDFQARTIIRDPRFQLAVVDAGTAVTRGLEFGINATLAKGLRAGGGYTYLGKATLVDDVLIPNVIRGVNNPINYKGARLPNAPKNAYNAYIDYTTDFPSPDLTSELRFEMRHRGQQQSVLTEDPLQEVAAYTIFDLYYTLAPKDSRWSATLYVKNITNHLYYERSYEPAVMGFTYGQMAYLPRDYARYFGANLRYKF
jgi:iron complex outermembrane receptor protein